MIKIEKILKYILIELSGSMVQKNLTRMTQVNQIKLFMKSLYPIVCKKKLIRFGPQSDGGHLIPDDIDGIEALFSPGASSASGFEKACANRKIKVFLVDKSVEKPAEEGSLFHFTSKFIGSMTNDSFMTLDNWVESSLPNSKRDLILQMDIEKFEYEVFLSMSENLINRFRIMVVEFHDLDQLWNRPFFTIASRVFEKILQTHSCVHIHPNNIGNTQKLNGIEIPQAMEFTFIRNDRINNNDITYQKIFPHPLDVDNDQNTSSVVLPSSWYQQ
jgi:hypothetical protein